MAEKKLPIDKMAEQLAENIVDRFSSVEKWKQTWNELSNIDAPFNAKTGEPYKGYNSLSLLASAIQNGFDDPRWMTYKQAQDQGFQVRKGESATYIGYFNVTPITKDTYIPKGLHVDKGTGKVIKDYLADQGIKKWGDLMDQKNPESLIFAATGDDNVTRKASALMEGIKNETANDIVFRTYAVFNANQIEGMPALESRKDPAQKIKTIESIIDNSGVAINVHSRNKPAYYPSNDTITMPRPEQYKDGYSYYADFAHELSHATAHKERLDRATPDYAREELVAELSSMLVANKAGLEMSSEHFDNHASYIKSWSTRISDNPREVFNVVREAGKSAEHITGLAEQPDKYINDTRKAFNDQRQTEAFFIFRDAVIASAENGTISPKDAAKSLIRARMNGLTIDANKQSKPAEAELE